MGLEVSDAISLLRWPQAAEVPVKFTYTSLFMYLHGVFSVSG
jgi:hypothetical protein